MTHQFESGMFVKVPAWHGLGTVIKDKVYSSEEALRLAGADWTVSLQTMKVGDREVPNSKAVQRDDTGAIIGVVGSSYVLKQNKDAFRFFDPFLHEKDCYISTAGVLSGGKKVFITAEIETSNNEIVDGDEIKNYLLLANAHDGSMKLTTKFVTERVVCANTLRVALAEGGAFRSVSHTSSMDSKLSQIQASLSLAKKSFEDTAMRYQQLAATNLSTEQFRGYLESLFTDDLKKASDRLERTANLEDVRACRKILNAYDNTPDLQLNGVRGTAWAAVNSVSEFLTHEKSKNTDSRYNSLWFGSDANLLDKAEKLAFAFV
jgi:phage/plasmid-like protein (TIGR03299 family)